MSGGAAGVNCPWRVHEVGVLIIDNPPQNYCWWCVLLTLNMWVWVAGGIVNAKGPVVSQLESMTEILHQFTINYTKDNFETNWMVV